MKLICVACSNTPVFSGRPPQPLQWRLDGFTIWLPAQQLARLAPGQTWWRRGLLTIIVNFVGMPGDLSAHC